MLWLVSLVIIAFPLREHIPFSVTACRSCGEDQRVQPSYRDFCFLSALLRDRLVKLKDTNISVCTINP